MSWLIRFASGDFTLTSLVSRSSSVVFKRSSHSSVNLNLPLIAVSASSACSFDFCHRFVASTTASSPVLVMPRLVANSHGDSPVILLNSLISLALNRLARVDIFAPLGVIAFTPDFTSRAIDFHTPFNPP